MLEGPLDALLDLPLDARVVVIGDMIPCHLGRFDEHFAHGGGPYDVLRRAKVGHAHLVGAVRERKGRERVCQRRVQAARYCGHTCLANQRGQVGPDVAVRPRGQVVQILLGQRVRHMLEHHLENRVPSERVWYPDLNVAIEATGPTERRIDGIGPIRSGDHHDMMRLYAV